jgi:hypothetical protein
MNDWYIAEQGDCINSIALSEGHFWETLWKHPQNLHLRNDRGNPDVLCAGDKVFLPELTLKNERGVTEKKHRFRRKGVPQHLVVQIRRDGKPVANMKYILKIEEKSVSGITDGDGWVDQPVSPDARKATLTVGTGRKALILNLRLGHLDPVSEISGLQARLRNLGYECGSISGQMTEATRDAMQAFQREQGIEQTAEPNERTRQSLQSEHCS